MKNDKYNDLDRRFQDHFREAEADMASSDKDSLWSSIQGARRMTWTYYLSIFTIVFLLGFGYWMIENKSNAKDQLEFKSPSVASNKKLLENKTEDLKHSVALVEDEGIGRIEKNKSHANEVYDSDQKLGHSIPRRMPMSDVAKTKQHQVSFVATKDEKRSISFLSNEEERIFNYARLPLKTMKQLSGDINFEAPRAQNPIKTQWDKCRVGPSGNWFADGYLQAAAPLETIEAGPEQQSYSDDWDRRFDPAMSYMAGAMIGYAFSWNLTIAAGLEYQHMQTEITNEQRIFETIRIYDPQAYYVIDAQGNRQYVGDTVTVTNVYDRQEKIGNDFEMWNIPIQLGYRQSHKDWVYGIDLTAMLNISMSYEGRFLLPNGNVIEVNEKNHSDYYEDNLGVSLSTGLHLGRMISDQVELYLEPRFRLNNRSYHVSDNNLRVERNFAGLRAGLRYTFE